MIENKKFQNEIARRIILYAGMCCMVLCVAIIITFVWLLHAGINQPIDYNYFRTSLILLVGVVCIGCLFSFVALYFIARSVALRSIMPLKEALERERMFTSYASHEFRTPLAVLKGSMEVLIRKERSHEEYQRKIRDDIAIVDEMNNMVDNLLMLTRAENGKITLSKSQCNVRDILTEVCTRYSDTIVRRHLRCNLSVLPDNLTVVTDKNAFEIIINNLLSNAVKYADEGGQLTINAYILDKKTLIEIVNTGKGIPQEECERVFDQFYRSISGGSQKIKGYGLGLSIVRRFSKIIGADVAIKSSVEGPTTAILTL